MLFCVRRGFQVPEPLMNVNHQNVHHVCFDDGTVRAIRLFKFVPGQLLRHVPASEQLLFEGGVFVKQFSDVFSVSQCKILVYFYYFGTFTMNRKS